MEVDTRLLEAKMKYHRRTHEQVAKCIGVNRGTLERKLRSGDFSIRQVHGLMEAVPLTMDDVHGIFFAEKKGRQERRPRKK